MNPKQIESFLSGFPQVALTTQGLEQLFDTIVKRTHSYDMAFEVVDYLKTKRNDKSWKWPVREGRARKLSDLFTRGSLARFLREDAQEGDTQSHVEGASGDSIDQQVDRLLAQYETDAKKTDEGGSGEVAQESFSRRQMERIPWNDLIKGRIVEAGEDDKDEETEDDAAPGAEEMTGQDTDKLGLDKLDVSKFADDVVRLIDNYDSLLEVRNTLMRRARAFLEKNYSEEVLNSYDDVLRDDHGMEPGKDSAETKADEFPAPAADRAAGSAEPGPGGGAGP